MHALRLRRGRGPLARPRALGAAVCATLAALAVAAVPTAGAAPSRATVVETDLLAPAIKASVQRLRSAQQAATAAVAPARAADPAARVAAARRLIETSRASGDPRLLGYAQAQLAPWPADDPATGPAVLLLHATLAQARHEFDHAAALLARVIARAPAGTAEHAQALLTRASIAQVRGELTAAAADCMRLAPLHADAAAVCSAINDALGDAPERAAATLQQVARRSDGTLRSWALGVLGQVHEQRADPAQARAAYRAALAAADDLALRLALADLLITQRAFEQASALLDSAGADASAPDGVLLRRWQIARARGQSAQAEALARQLDARFALARQRGERSHARDAAQYALARGDAVEALALARENWHSQREPADLLLLARAARAAQDAAALDEVRAWQRRTGLVDQRLRPLLQGGDA